MYVVISRAGQLSKSPGSKPWSRCLIQIITVLLFGNFSVLAADWKVLPGHVPQIVPGLVSKGRLAATNELQLAIGLQMRDRAGLENFVARVSDPASPDFRHFISREELTDRFGPTTEDYEAVKRFAVTNGLSIKGSHANRLLLDVSGPAAAIEKAFHITLRTYRHPTEARDFFAPDTEPTVEEALPVVDVQGLSDYWLAHPRRAKKVAAHPRQVNGTAPDGSGDLFGNDFRNAYVPGTTLTGAGQSVGLFELDGFFTNDISNYAKAAGNGRTNIIVTADLIDNYNGKPSTGIYGDEGEVELDIEMAMAIAPGLSKIVSFEGGKGGRGNQNDVLNAMLASSNILNLSCSWGWDGPSNSTDVIFESMDAVGQSFFNASGDSAAFTSGSTSVNGVDNPAAQNAPSSNPDITQVGGTTLEMNGAGNAWGSEIVWNWNTEYPGEGYDGVASSGGVSSHYLIPGWQTNVSNLAGIGGSTAFRNIPDVAANADNVYELFNNGDTNADATDDNAGTSCAAPLWAGFMALVNQQAAATGMPAVGFINPAIYAIAAGSDYDSCFHDITSGNNTWSESPNLFYAENNYDLCTGLGTMNGTSLINALVVTPVAPVLLPPVINSDGLTLTWITVPGNAYQLQYTTNLSSRNWVNLGNATNAAGFVLSASDSFSQPQRFYRVVLLR